MPGRDARRLVRLVKIEDCDKPVAFWAASQVVTAFFFGCGSSIER